MNTDANKKVAVKLALVAGLMFGFGYALVPLYNVFCEVTGLNGKTGRIAGTGAGKSTAADRLVTVEFDTNVNSMLPWKFKAAQRRLEVRPGEITEALFYAENLSSETVIGQAVPSVAPSQASLYFNKTECFCFTQQMLGPGETREMPVRFIIDPDLPGKIRIMTLSYTFFRLPDTGGNSSIASARIHPAPDREVFKGGI